ncbi:hypothetical protein mRhiFer1_009897 [Rhinolophus ferrumequinum]|uniref:Uncharacterized protein n=1 Tax=Rhinolophus ferrumequinum TaxID=59479 RepID=A0A7J7YI52_RHIFE|nr:hypothetical protein mRhiFer1_009897 [Rhinolophus ferrumequinum]
MPYPSALGRLGPLLMRPASQVLVIAPTGHPFGESKASLLWQWHLDRAYRTQGNPGAPGSLSGSCPHHLPPSQPMSQHRLTPPGAAWPPSETLAAVTPPTPQSLGTLSPFLPALHLFTEPWPFQAYTLHSIAPDLSLFTLPLTPKPSDVTHLPIKPVDFGVLCSVSGVLCIC